MTDRRLAQHLGLASLQTGKVSVGSMCQWKAKMVDWHGGGHAGCEPIGRGGFHAHNLRPVETRSSSLVNEA